MQIIEQGLILIQNRIGFIQYRKNNLLNDPQKKNKLANVEYNIELTADDIINEIDDHLKQSNDIVEGMINHLIEGINDFIDTLNGIEKVQFTSPITGREYELGFSLPKLNYVTMPHLAQGAVIPPNREFMAVLGDQSNGTNIEAPLDTIKQAVAEVLANNGNAEMIQLLQQLIAVVESKNLSIGDKEIGQANARYTQRQNRVRGVSF